MKIKEILKYIALALKGFISNHGFAPNNFLPAFFIPFIIFTFIVFNAQNKKQAFLYGYIFGFSHFVFGLSWITNALLIDEFTIDTFSWLIPFFYAGVGIVFGLFFAIPSLLAYFGKNSLSKVLIFTSSFTILEILRECLLTGFPWNKIGAIWSDYNYILQSASIIGTNGLTFLTILLGCFVYLIFNFQQNKKSISSLIGFTSLAVMGLMVINTITIRPIKLTDQTVKIVQPGIQQKLKWKPEEVERNFLTHLEFSKQGEKADFIIWSETAVSYDLINATTARTLATSILNENNYLITGFPHADNSGKLFNMVGLFNKSGVIATYAKSHLVPFGEYIPFKKYIPMKTITNQLTDLTPGEGLETITADGFSFSPLICYEGIFSGQVVQKNTNPNFILILTNDAWYGLSRGPYQHLVEAQLRAIEEGKPVIRAGYNGISAVIDSNGRILKSLPLNTSGIIDFKIPDRGYATIYSVTKQIPLFIFCVLLLGITFVLNIVKKSEKKK